MVAPQVLSAVGQVGEIAGYTFERGIGHAEAWHVAVTMAVMHTEEFPGFNPVPLLAVAAVGAVWSVLRRSPGLTPVFEDGGTVVYAVNQTFTDTELDRLRAESPASPRPQPQVLEDPEAQDAQAPRHHRPTVPRPERLKGTPAGWSRPRTGTWAAGSPRGRRPRGWAPS
ncbi:hypothetical protein [Corynebacterium frankenforstense]